MTLRRWVLAVAGFAIWATGLYLLVGGSWAPGGGLILLGGLCLVIAASGGWDHFYEGLSNWLYFWR